MLYGPPTGEEIKGLVGNEGSTDGTGYVIPLQVVVLAARKISPSCALIAEVVHFVAVDGVASAAADDVHGSRRRDRGRDVQVGLRYLEFLDRVFGDILSRRSDVFVGNIESIQLDACSAPEASPKGDGREAIFGRIEAGAILNL